MQHDTLTCRHSLIVALSLSLFPSLSLSLSFSLSLSLTLFFERARVSLPPLPPPFCHPTLLPLYAAYRRKGPLISIFRFQKDFSLLLPPFFSLPPSLSFSYSFRPAHTFAPLALSLLPCPTLFAFLTLLPRPSNVSSVCKCPLPAQKSGLSGFIFVRRGWTFTRLIVRGDTGFSKNSFKTKSSKLSFTMFR